jgi:hypothetical protein
MYLITSGTSLQALTEEQYYLATRANIGIEESNLLPEFEKEALLSLVIRDLNNKKKNIVNEG